MPKPSVLLKFQSPAPPDLMHRVLNFVEEVHVEAQRKGIGAIRDIDHYAAGEFPVELTSSRHLGEVKTLIARLLRNHHLESEALVLRPDRPKGNGDV